jgi:hypothetical protein
MHELKYHRDVEMKPLTHLLLTFPGAASYTYPHHEAGDRKVWRLLTQYAYLWLGGMEKTGAQHKGASLLYLSGQWCRQLSRSSASVCSFKNSKRDTTKLIEYLGVQTMLVSFVNVRTPILEIRFPIRMKHDLHCQHRIPIDGDEDDLHEVNTYPF